MAPGLAAADILAAGALADLAGILPGSAAAVLLGLAAGGILANSARFDHGRFDHGRFGRFRGGFGFGGPYWYGGSYGYYGYGYDSCYVLTPSGYVWVCY